MMKTLLTKIVVFLLCFESFTVFGQSTTIKNTMGNGPILSGLKIDDAKLINGQGNLENMGIGSMLANGNKTVTTKHVRVDVYCSGKITQYKYNGKTYGTEYQIGDCSAKCWDCDNRRIKMTAKIEVNGKVLTASDEAIAPFKPSTTFKFEKSIPFKDVKLISVVVEPIPYPDYESDLDEYEACLKKEKEKEKKDPEKKETAKTDDDFWNGGEKETKTRKIVGISNDDFWSGKEEEKKKDVEKVVKETKIEQTENEEYVYVFITVQKFSFISDKNWITNVFKINKELTKLKRQYTKMREMKLETRTLYGEIKNEELKLLAKVEQFMRAHNISCFDDAIPCRPIISYNELEKYGDFIKYWQKISKKENIYKNDDKYILLEGFYPYGK